MPKARYQRPEARQCTVVLLIYILTVVFVISVLDDTHLFIAADMVERLQDQIDDLMDKMNVPVVDGKNAEAKN